VYVEKPVSHSVWEGERIVEEARAKGRIVQAGTQYRPCPGLRAAAWLREGRIGEPLWAQVVWYEHRPPIGKCAPFTPTDLDYDLWCGPALLEPLTRPKLHYDWHWVWSTGDGDLGNSGIHAFDACRMFIPVCGSRLATSTARTSGATRAASNTCGSLNRRAWRKGGWLSRQRTACSPRADKPSARRSRASPSPPSPGDFS
jgi:predicted dehydrogenase